MPKKGNWGDWAIIDLPPIEIKKVSCYACVNYCEEDGSCLKTAIIPHKDGNKSAWKKCNYFGLASEYMTYSFMEAVKVVKGPGFFDKKEVENEVIGKNEIITENTDKKRTSTYYHMAGKGKKIQFNVKSAKELRDDLGLYYGARHYIGKKESILEKNKCIIEKAIQKIPDSLLTSFTSVDIKKFADAVALFLVENGLPDATGDNCIDYCIAIHSIALDLTFSRQKNTGKLNLTIEKAVLLLDALTTLLFDLNLIHDGKYKALLNKLENA